MQLLTSGGNEAGQPEIQYTSTGSRLKGNIDLAAEYIVGIVDL